MADFFKIGQAAGGSVNVSKAIGEGLQSAQKTFTQFLDKKIKEERAYNIDKAKKLSAFGDNYNPDALDGKNRAVMNKFLQNSRMEYSNLIDQTRNLNPSSEEYINALSKAEQIKSGFNETLKNTLEFSELGAEYIKAAQEDKVSSGMAKEDIALFDKIWIDKDYELVRDSASGELSYKVDGKVIPKEKLDDWRIPNTQFAKQFVTNYNESAYKVGITSGKKLTPEDFEYKQLEFGVTQDLNSMPIEEIRSLFLDKTIGKSPLIISSPGEDLFSLTKDELIAKAQSGLMKNILDTNQKGASQYKAPEKKINLSAAQEKLLRISDVYENAKESINPIVNSFFNSEKNALAAASNFQRLGLDIGGEIKNEEGNIIGYEVKHPVVGRNTFIPINNAGDAARALQNALGYADLGNVDKFKPVTTEVNTGDTSPTSGSNEPTPIPGLINEEEYPEDFTNLSTEPSVSDKQRKDKTFRALDKIGIPKYKAGGYSDQIRKEITTYYGGEFSDLNINKAVFDLFGREKYNEKVVKDYNEGESQNKALEEIQKKSTEPFNINQLKSIDGVKEIGTALNKKGVDLTPQDLEIFKYMKESGKSLQEVKAILTESDLPITE